PGARRSPPRSRAPAFRRGGSIPGPAPARRSAPVASARAPGPSTRAGSSRPRRRRGLPPGTPGSGTRLAPWGSTAPPFGGARPAVLLAVAVVAVGTGQQPLVPVEDEAHQLSRL